MRSSDRVDFPNRVILGTETFPAHLHLNRLGLPREAGIGRVGVGTPWSCVDAVSSWSWDAPAGAPVTVDVYSDADELELLLDGASVARARSASTSRPSHDSRRPIGPAS